jgi:Flp pilus assembly protein TadG
MNIRHKSWRRRDAGASAVEMAIVLPVLALLVFGIIDFGRMLTAEIQISQAAREGVRIAALGAAPTDVAARAVQAAPLPGLGTGGAVIPITSPAMLTCPTSPTVGQVAQVQVTYYFKGIIIPGTRTLTQSANQRC